MVQFHSEFFFRNVIQSTKTISVTAFDLTDQQPTFELIYMVKVEKNKKVIISFLAILAIWPIVP